MLDRIALPGSGRQTTRLGFGGSGLMGGLGERESLLLLETAFEAGIRHFDVAPSYGHGEAERCLRKFLRGKADQVTVTTKYGILPAPGAGVLRIARTFLRPVLRAVPSVRKRASQMALALQSKARFSADEARKALDRSRQNLGLDRIDVWLLHEATAEDLNDPVLLQVLHQAQRAGEIGTFGVGSERKRVQTLWSTHREYCPVIQTEASLFTEKLSFPGTFCIHHRAISEGLARMRHQFELDLVLCRRWSEALDADLARTEILSGILLQAALAANPDGMVLFSSRVSEHIHANARAAESPADAARGKMLVKMIAG